MIEWTDFSWEAFATLATGGLAFIAAIVIATLQSRILRHQADLQAQIAREAHTIERHKIKTDLFDKRIAVYEDVRKWLASVIESGNLPFKVQDDLIRGAIDRSRFLFHRSVTDRLNLLYRDSIINWAGPNAEPSDEEGNHTEEYQAWERLTEASEHLYALFGDELRLGSLDHVIEIVEDGETSTVTVATSS